MAVMGGWVVEWLSHRKTSSTQHKFNIMKSAMINISCHQV